MRSLKKLFRRVARSADSDDNEIKLTPKSPTKLPTHKPPSLRSYELGTPSETNTRAPTTLLETGIGIQLPLGSDTLGTARSAHSFGRSRSISSDKHSLRRLLKQERVKCHPRRHDYFIPRSILKSLIVEENVVKDLHAQDPDMDVFTIHQAARQVCEGGAQHLYAILAILGMAPDIVRLLEEGVSDGDLPLVIREGESGKLLMWKANGCPIQTFATWQNEMVEKFDFNQYRIHAPYFHDGCHYVFDSCVILPFIRLKAGENSNEKEGGYSSVFPIRIHPDHHDFWPLQSEDKEPLVAVKKLFSSDPNEFKKEQDILLKLGCKNHPHLIKLLATYSIDAKYHLMFPWADGNLRTFWSEYQPRPNFDATTTLWSLQQMLGITQALSLIHNFRPTLPLSAPQTKRPNSKNLKLDVKQGEEQYGRHGDIKPENILWFMKGGVLQIADFGLGRFHGRESRSQVDPDTITASPSYESPELKLGLKITRGYDVWSLGCIFLEFITWLLQGGDDIEVFSDFRGRLVPSTGIDDDCFYTILQDAYGRKTAVVRYTVVEWSKRLHANPKCSQLVHELLDLTISELLAVKLENRINSQQLAMVLADMFRRAQSNEIYMLDPVAYNPKQGRRSEPQAQPDNTRAAQHLIESVLPHVFSVGNGTRDLVGRTLGTPGSRTRSPWAAPQGITSRSTN